MNIKFRDLLKTKIKGAGERGIGLVEAAVALALLGGVVLTMVFSLSGGAIAVEKDDELETAQGLARTEMEYIKAYTYNATATTYPAVSAPSSYSINVTVSAVPDANSYVQKVVVSISKAGRDLFTIQDYKEDR